MRTRRSSSNSQEPMRTHSLPDALTYAPYTDEGEITSARQGDWGWPEIFVAMQLLWGALLFIPGAQSYRTLIRAAPYVLSGAAVIYYFRHGKDQPLPWSTMWLLLSFGLLLLNLL